jgi:hypothetical protein
LKYENILASIVTVYLSVSPAFSNSETGTPFLSSDCLFWLFSEPESRVKNNKHNRKQRFFWDFIFIGF